VIESVQAFGRVVNHIFSCAVFALDKRKNGAQKDWKYLAAAGQKPLKRLSA
jgi:hypothetical protein